MVKDPMIDPLDSEAMDELDRQDMRSIASTGIAFLIILFCLAVGAGYGFVSLVWLAGSALWEWVARLVA